MSKSERTKSFKLFFRRGGWIALTIPLLLLFQNCSAIQNLSSASQSTEGGNDQGYGGKLFVQIGRCVSSELVVKNRILVNGDGTTGVMNLENCQPSQRPVSGIRAMPTQDAISFQGAIYSQSNVLDPLPAVAQQKTLATFVKMQSLFSILRAPSGQELDFFVTGYDPANARGCRNIAETYIRGQDSMTLQEAMAARDRAIFVIRALLDKDPSEPEITQWTERAGFTWQQVYQSILSSPDFAARCSSYNLEL